MERPRDPFIVTLDLDERGRLMAVAEVGWTGGAVRATLKLARLAGECGLHGVVASAREARAYAARARRASCAPRRGAEGRGERAACGRRAEGGAARAEQRGGER